MGTPTGRARKPKELFMTTIEVRDRAKTSARVAPAKSAQSKSDLKFLSAPAATRAETGDEQQRERVTKHDRVLTLLSQRDGASIPEMMEATGWQQHSVRGFLAGTVKKKLGFMLTSSKSDGELRRYRIETKRGRQQ
jgi:hypothetical protein